MNVNSSLSKPMILMQMMIYQKELVNYAFRLARQFNLMFALIQIRFFHTYTTTTTTNTFIVYGYKCTFLFFAQNKTKIQAINKPKAEAPNA